jgi:hypothetical protein
VTAIVQLLDWLAAWPGAVLLQQPGIAYLFVNAAHILGIGLLLGSILPFDLHLIGRKIGVDGDHWSAASSHRRDRARSH